MKGHSHYKPVAAVAVVVALLCLVATLLPIELGFHSVRPFGVRMGVARVKSIPFLFVGDDRNRFDVPFDSVMSSLAVVSAAIALWAAWRLKSQRACAEPGVAPNGGPATPAGESGVPGGPPSVS